MNISKTPSVAAARFYRIFRLWRTLRSSSHADHNQLGHLTRKLHSTSGRPSEQPTVSVKRDSNTSNVNVFPDLSNHIRHLMRSVPHPVVVVTASSASTPSDTAEYNFRGMTVSSFNTVTLSPKPYVSLNVKVPSATYSALSESHTFLVHILSASRIGARIANAFASGTNASGQVFRDLVRDQGHTGQLQVFSGPATHGAPLLAGDGILRVLRCRAMLEKTMIIEDHVVLVAEVLGIMTPPSSSRRRAETYPNDEATEQVSSLLYGNRDYRQLGSIIELGESGSAGRNPEESSQSSEIHRTMGLNVRRGDENDSTR